MAFLKKGVGAREQEEGRIPEPDKVGHEGLFVGKNEPANHDQQLCDDHQQRKPDEPECAREGGNNE